MNKKYTYEQLNAMSAAELTDLSRKLRSDLAEREKFRQERIQDVLRLQEQLDKDQFLYDDKRNGYAGDPPNHGGSRGGAAA